MTESLNIRRWREVLESDERGMYLVCPGSTIQIFFGSSEGGDARIVFRSVHKPLMPALSSLVDVERYQDSAGRWNLSLALRDPKFTHVFMRLGEDIVARSSQARTELSALAAVSGVISEWWQLLKPRAVGLLSMEQLRGLVAELWMLLFEFATVRPIEAAIVGWQGPLGLPQDFWFPESGFHEVKAVGPSAAEIDISSAKQLDQPDLELLVLSVANSVEGTPGSVSLQTLSQQIYDALAHAGSDSAEFDAKLSRLGVSLNEPLYGEAWFLVSACRRFRVSADFPAIRESTLPLGIGHVRYQLNLAHLNQFDTGTLEVG